MTARIALSALVIALASLSCADGALAATPVQVFGYLSEPAARVDGRFVAVRTNLYDDPVLVFDLSTGARFGLRPPMPCHGDPSGRQAGWSAGGGQIAWTCDRDPAWPDVMIQDVLSRKSVAVGLPGYGLDLSVLGIGRRMLWIQGVGDRGSVTFVMPWSPPDAFRSGDFDRDSEAIRDLDTPTGSRSLCAGLAREPLPLYGDEPWERRYRELDYAPPWALDRRDRQPGRALRLRRCSGPPRTVARCPSGCWGATMHDGWVAWTSDTRMYAYRVRDGRRHSWALPRYRSGRWASVVVTRTQVVASLPSPSFSDGADAYAAELTD